MNVMNKIKLFFLALAAMMAFAACEKDDQVKPIIDEPAFDPCSLYLGTYDFLQVYDSISTDGEWMENGYAGIVYSPDTGYFAITKAADADSTLKLDGYLVFVNGDGPNDTIHFFETTANIMPDGSVFLNDSQYTTDYGLVFDISYMLFRRADDGTLTFRSKQHANYGGYLLGYITTITCTPRQ